MKSLGWSKWIVLLAFVLVVSFTGFFAFRTAQRAIYWHYHKDETIRPWMNVGYIAHSYQVPPHVLYRAIGLPNKPPDRRPIRDIARAQNRTVDDVIADIKSAIVHSRPPYPPPPPPDDGESR
jgi:hypothetical protein